MPDCIRGGELAGSLQKSTRQIDFQLLASKLRTEKQRTKKWVSQRRLHVRRWDRGMDQSFCAC